MQQRLLEPRQRRVFFVLGQLFELVVLGQQLGLVALAQQFGLAQLFELVRLGQQFGLVALAQQFVLRQQLELVRLGQQFGLVALGQRPRLVRLGQQRAAHRIATAPDRQVDRFGQATARRHAADPDRHRHDDDVAAGHRRTRTPRAADRRTRSAAPTAAPSPAGAVALAEVGVERADDALLTGRTALGRVARHRVVDLAGPGVDAAIELAFAVTSSLTAAVLGVRQATSRMV